MIWNTRMVDARFYQVVDKLGALIERVSEADTNEGSLVQYFMASPEINPVEQAKRASIAAVRAFMGKGIVMFKSYPKYFEIVDTRNGEVLDLYDESTTPKATPAVYDDTKVEFPHKEEWADEAAGWESGSLKLKEPVNIVHDEDIIKTCTCKNGCKSAQCDKI